MSGYCFQKLGWNLGQRKGLSLRLVHILLSSGNFEFFFFFFDSYCCCFVLLFFTLYSSNFPLFCFLYHRYVFVWNKSWPTRVYIEGKEVIIYSWKCGRLISGTVYLLNGTSIVSSFLFLLHPFPGVWQSSLSRMEVWASSPPLPVLQWISHGPSEESSGLCLVSSPSFSFCSSHTKLLKFLTQLVCSLFLVFSTFVIFYP